MVGGYLATRPKVMAVLIITPVATTPSLPHNTPLPFPVLRLLLPATIIPRLRMARQHTPNHWPHTAMVRLSQVPTPMARDPTRLT